MQQFKVQISNVLSRSQIWQQVTVQEGGGVRGGGEQVKIILSAAIIYILSATLTAAALGESIRCMDEKTDQEEKR